MQLRSGQHGQERHVRHAEKRERGADDHDSANHRIAADLTQAEREVSERAPPTRPAQRRDAGDHIEQHRKGSEVRDGQKAEADRRSRHADEQACHRRAHDAGRAHRRRPQRHGVDHELTLHEIGDQGLPGGQIDGVGRAEDDRDGDDGSERCVVQRHQHGQRARRQPQRGLRGQEDAAPGKAVG